METHISEEEMHPQCLLCENDNVNDLVQCSFCNQVWYCDEKEDNDDTTRNENGYKNGDAENEQIKTLRYHGYPHRPLGLNYCQPFKVSRRQGKGRVLEASRNIKEGELVVVDKALAVLPDDKPVCLGCLGDVSCPLDNQNESLDSSETPTCSKCSFPICGKVNCDKSKWHSGLECSALTKAGAANKLFKNATTSEAYEFQEVGLSPAIRINQFYHVIAILRFILAQQSCSTVIREQIQMLTDHNETRLKEKGGGWIMKHIYAFIKDDCQLDSKVEYCDVTRAFGVMQTNSMSTCGLQGKAVYPTVSLMSHSCYNNLTVAAGPGEGVAFKALRPIKRGDELTIRYVDLKKSRNQIRQELYRNWLFWCECERCSDPTELNTFLSSPLCEICNQCNKFNNGESGNNGELNEMPEEETLNSNSRNMMSTEKMASTHEVKDGQISCYVPLNPLDISSEWTCTICKHTVSPARIRELEEIAQKIVFSDQGISDDLKKSSIATILKKIETLESMFVPTYIHTVKLKYKFITEYEIPKSDSKLQKIKSRYCREILPVFDRLEGNGSKEKCEMLKELAKSELSILGTELNIKTISKEEYMKKIKPYVALQMKANKMMKS